MYQKPGGRGGGGGGRTSDKFLTENCGFLEKLLPGDMVMADRGFTISETVGLKQAKLEIPAFTKGKSQLDPVDVENTRGIANVRIHVERVIGLLRRKYTILEGTLPTEYLACKPNGPVERQIPLIDRIVRICAALVNFCPPIVYPLIKETIKLSLHLKLSRYKGLVIINGEC